MYHRDKKNALAKRTHSNKTSQKDLAHTHTHTHIVQQEPYVQGSLLLFAAAAAQRVWASRSPRTILLLCIPSAQRSRTKISAKRAMSRFRPDSGRRTHRRSRRTAPSRQLGTQTTISLRQNGQRAQDTRTNRESTYRAALQCFCCVRPMLHVGPSVRLGSATFSRPAAGCRCPTPASDALKSSRVLARSPAPGTAHRYRCG